MSTPIYQEFEYIPKRNQRVLASSFSALVAAASCFAAIHSGAPLIEQDPQANLTVVYAFIGVKYDNSETKVLNVLVSVRPFSEPGAGVICERFSTDSLCNIHLANPTTGKSFRQCDFRFSSTNSNQAPVLKNPNTILSYGLGVEVGTIGQPGDARQNFTQYYWVAKNRRDQTEALVIPLPNVGGSTTPFCNDPEGVALSGATTRAELDSYTRDTIYDLPEGKAAYAAGRWVQVNRMGNPLFNEVLVPLKDQDANNRSTPASDNRYASYATNPEIATLVNTVYGTYFQASGRADLRAVFIPDVLRANTLTELVRLPGQEGYSRLGFIGGDTTSGTNSGWPNGRRIGDDVVDIALSAVASGPSYQTVRLAGDNVDSNDAS